MALLKEYFKLTNEYREKYGEKTLLLMEVGSFFEVYTKVDPNTREITDQQVIDVFMGMDELYPDGLTAKIENLLEADQYAHFLDETYQLDDSHTFKLSVGNSI